jgi:hypothetical protein
MERWRGLKALVQDTVEHGSRAVERLQKEAAKRPFDLLEKIQPLEVPVKGIREIHDTAISGVHGMIRLVNRVAGDTADMILNAVEQDKAQAVEKDKVQPERPVHTAGESTENPADKAL